MSIVATSFKSIKLFKPEDFYKEDYFGKACFSYEYKKYGFFENWKLALEKLQGLPDQYKLFCELIPEKTQVKPYFDIEWYDHEFPDYDNNTVLGELKQKLVEIVQDTWGISLKKADFYISECHRETRKGDKNSFHIIISPEESIIFNEASECLFLAKELQTKIQFDSSIIDLNVYKKKQQFRIIGHSKKDEVCPMKKVNNGKQGTDENYMITCITPIHRILECKEQETPNQLKALNNARNITLEDTEIIAKILKLVQTDFHKSAYFTDRIDHNNFLFFNYTDRSEPCFSDRTRTHENLGFWVYVRESGQAYIGCYSSNCRDHNNKAISVYIGDVDEPDPAEKKFIPVTYDEDLHINTKLVSREIRRDAIGLSNMFNYAYLSGVKRIKWVDNGSGKNGTSYFWDGKIWKEDSFNFLFRLISEKLPQFVEKLIVHEKGGDDLDESASQMSYLTDDDDKIKFYKSIIKKLHSGMINNSIINFIKPNMHDPYFDKIKNSHPGYLSTFNGIVDLKTSIIRPSEPEDNITRTLELSYLPETFGKDTANYILFDNFIKDITRNQLGEYNDTMYNFMKWTLGYALQGNPKKKMFFIFWGPEGYNGKSLLLNTISNVLEDYAITMDKSVVLEAPKKTAGSASSELMRLENCRFGILGDTKEGSALDDGQVKGLTSVTDSISARELYGKQKEFLPTFVPIIATNHRIRVNLSDPAMYDRLMLIPFWIKFISNPNPENPRHRESNLELPELFATKDFKSSILCWLIDASVYYHQNQNLEIPQEIKNEKDKYRQEMNIYLEFIDQECDRPDVLENLDAESKLKNIILKTEFIDSFINYCIKNGIKIAPNKAEKDMDKYIPITRIDKITYYYNIKWKSK